MLARNYFELLNLPAIFDLDMLELDKNYFQLQIQFHPDKALTSQEREQNIAIASKINSAYQALRDEFSRSIELLKIANIDIQNCRDQLDAKFLEQRMQDFQTIQESSSGDILSDMLVAKYIEKKQLVEALSLAFSKNNLQQCSIITMSLKYIDNIIGQTKEKLQKLAAK
jgi:molecular chaperone HscB